MPRKEVYAQDMLYGNGEIMNGYHNNENGVAVDVNSDISKTHIEGPEKLMVGAKATISYSSGVSTETVNIKREPEWRYKDKVDYVTGLAPKSIESTLNVYRNSSRNLEFDDYEWYVNTVHFECKKKPQNYSSTIMIFPRNEEKTYVTNATYTINNYPFVSEYTVRDSEEVVTETAKEEEWRTSIEEETFEQWEVTRKVTVEELIRMGIDVESIQT